MVPHAIVAYESDESFLYPGYAKEENYWIGYFLGDLILVF